MNGNFIEKAKNSQSGAPMWHPISLPLVQEVPRIFPSLQEIVEEVADVSTES
jgi:hypothetical protein